MSALGSNRSVEHWQQKTGLHPFPIRSRRPDCLRFVPRSGLRTGDPDILEAMPFSVSFRSRRCSGGDQQLPVDFSELINHVLVAGVHSFNKRFQHRYLFASGH